MNMFSFILSSLHLYRGLFLTFSAFRLAFFWLVIHGWSCRKYILMEMNGDCCRYNMDNFAFIIFYFGPSDDGQEKKSMLR